MSRNTSVSCPGKMNNAPANRPDTNKTSALAVRESRSSGPFVKGRSIHDVGSIASVASTTPARMMSPPKMISTRAATLVNSYFIYLAPRGEVEEDLAGSLAERHDAHQPSSSRVVFSYGSLEPQETT